MSGIDIISDTTGKAIAESIKALSTKMSGGKVVYGVHINSGDSNPSTSVRYLADAAGMTPAKMNYTTGKFEYGSWGDAFFLPRPCMLKTDGTVDYYLDENDYSKKADGTASDITNVNYNGNAMMEWGDGTNLIWWKIEPDKGNPNSASLYVANYQADKDFKNLNFIDINGNGKAHFYTPIYNGSLDSNNKLRSISGQTVIKLKTVSQEMTYARANGTGYEIEQYVDRLLINILLIIIGKSTDTQDVFGRGMSENASAKNILLKTGTMDSKGLFWGENAGKAGVKVFGMENYYGNQWRRTVGLILANGIVKVKLSPSTKDGSSATNYNTDGTGYIEIPNSTPSGTSGGHIKDMLYTALGMFPISITGSSSTYYPDSCQFNIAIIALTLFGGNSSNSRFCGAFCINEDNVIDAAWWSVGASLSYK
nr:MAG TPA: tail collar fiber protein [Caudoviricetes sp.]